MNPSFEGLVIHHDSSFRSILEDDPISSTFKAHIHFCSSKGSGLWLIVKPSIYSFHITHFIFTSTLHFHFDLIQPLAFNFFMCEYGHGLDTYGTHLSHFFGGQWVAAHDAIRDIMYAFT